MTASPRRDVAIDADAMGPVGASLPGDGSRRKHDDADHIRSEGARALPIDWLVTPGLALSHPNEVLDHPELSQAERRAILASWASDARALEGARWMRCLDNGSVVTLAEVLDALRKLDAQTALRPDGMRMAEAMSRAPSVLAAPAG